MKSGEKREDELFRDASRLTAGPERKAFLDQACKGNPVLRERMEALLQANDTPHSALECLIDRVPGLPMRPDLALTEGPGSKIGRYKLLQQIGEGGMGVVYMAEQEEPVRRRVALKIIKLGMDTQQVIARFEAERQALALMDHPNIAQVFDGGATETGRPYFVMELVRGVPITEFCDQNKLTAHERLKLFILVCQAIQSAHQKGIIHRDLKPTNVLVTQHYGEPMPKVIDFGVAKATNQKLTEKTLFTQFATLIGTPAYMSPEQAEMSSLDVDTRADLYSLGVLLYELLTGTTPFSEKRLRSMGYGEMQRVIMEEEPERPSTRLNTLNDEQKTAMVKTRGQDVAALGELLKGDLDWIVMKCLEKDRRRRYESASGLAADLERHFSNEPVLARPPTVVYRLTKAIRRNQGAFAAAAVILITLLVGITVSVSQAIRATQAEHKQAGLRTEADAARRVAVAAQAEAEKTAENLREQNYAMDMRLACNALAGEVPGQAWAIVQRQRPQTAAISASTIIAHEDLRGWEWRHLWEQTRPVEQFTLLKEAFEIKSMAFPPGSSPLLAFLVEEQLKIWDYKKRAQLKVLPLSLWSRGIGFSPDGKWCACGDRGILVWDTAMWNLHRQIPRPNDYFGFVEVAFSPDSRLMAGASTVEVRVLNTSTFEEWASLPAFYDHNLGATACGLAFSPDGRTLAYGVSNNLIQLWDTASKSPTFQLPTPISSVNTLCFSPDGRNLVAGTQPPDACVRVYDLTARGTSKELMRCGPNLITRVRFSPDGKRLAVGCAHMVQMFNTATWEKMITYQGHVGIIVDLGFSSDGKWLASSSTDGTIRIWSGEPTAPEPDEQAMPPGVKWSALSPGGETLLTIYTNSTFSLWNTATLKEGPRQPFPGAISKLDHWDKIPWGAAVAPEGKRIAYLRPDGVLGVWDVAGQRPVAFMVPKTNDVHCIRFSYDGNTVAFSEGPSDYGEVWEVEGKTNLLSFYMPGVILSFDFSRDGKQLAVGATDSDSFGQIWNLTQRRLTAQLLSKRPGRRNSTQIALSNNSRFAATVGNDGALRLWDLQIQSESRIVEPELYSYSSITFSPDDSRVAASASTYSVLTNGGAIKVIGVQTGTEFASIQAPVGLVSFLPDGNTLVLQSWDSRLLRFRAAPFAETDAVDKSK